VIKAPDGSMNRTVIAGVMLTRERREARQLEARKQADEESKGAGAPLAAQWHDLLASAAPSSCERITGWNFQC
jgi:ATP-dependent RNA helicase DHX8/PRP22